MSRIMVELVRCSIVMSIISTTFFLFLRISKNRYSPTLFYYISAAILIGFAFPIKPKLSTPVPFFKKEDSSPLANLPNDNTFFSSMEQTIKRIPVKVSVMNGFSKIQFFFFLWLVVAVAILLYYGVKHFKFVKTVERWLTTDFELENAVFLLVLKEQFCISSNLDIKRCSCIGSPMLIRLKTPTILLPDRIFSLEELELIIRHEMVHFKRKDLLFRKMMFLAVVVNWFNPIVYILAKVFTNYCELSCDETVVGEMNRKAKYKYASIILETANQHSKQGTLLAALFYGGKQNMKNRLSAIVDPKGKKLKKELLIGCFVLVIGLSMIGTLPTQASVSEAESLKSYGIKTDAEIAAEMKEAFSEEFSNKFDEKNFSGMDITYDKDGIPIVHDPNPVKGRAVTAKGRYQSNGFYSHSSCSNGTLLFWVPKGNSVEVLDSAVSTKIAKVKYAGQTGYMKKSELVF